MWCMAKRLETIRASEVGEYLYCARSWWLRRVAGLAPEGRERRERGVRMHARHGRAVAASGLLIWVGCVVLLLAILVLALR
jgi:CRISPR/Cas system-associated exonuclease Cas4 (RecB family)